MYDDTSEASWERQIFIDPARSIHPSGASLSLDCAPEVIFVVYRMVNSFSPSRFLVIEARERIASSALPGYTSSCFKLVSGLLDRQAIQQAREKIPLSCCGALRTRLF